ncbi:MAG TPA: hypothetical protein VN408_22290 [Actinoplanes sp.]|nr:hypothetical protein [Actinoplanes sp.]
MTISPLTTAIVPGPARTGIDLTLVLALDGNAPAWRYVVDRLVEALYAQCITFEMVAVASVDGVPAAELTDLPLSRYIRTDRLDRDSSITTGLEMGSGRWVGVLDIEDGVEPYDFIEMLHQARERCALVK